MARRPDRPWSPRVPDMQLAAYRLQGPIDAILRAGWELHERRTRDLGYFDVTAQGRSTGNGMLFFRVSYLDHTRVHRFAHHRQSPVQ